MAFLEFNHFSETLGLMCTMNVVLPHIPRTDLLSGNVQPFPTLYLLHGLSDDHSVWMRRTSIERYAEEHRLAVIMPAVHRSFYTDMAGGYPYWTYISEEVPALARAVFPLSPRREDTFVAGLSMGGYGAFKLALTYPQRFAAAASFSGALDVVEICSNPDQEWQRELTAIFGPQPYQVKNSPADIFHLAENLIPEDKSSLRLFQWCGTEDFLYSQNLRFRDHASSLGLNLTYTDGPGDHRWCYWDEMILKFINWLNLPPTTG